MARDHVACRASGLRQLATDYYTRYGLPLFHCETNRVNRFAADWLANQWNDILVLLDSGLYDLNRKLRPVGNAYRALIEDYSEMMSRSAPAERSFA